jgi:hypothetical protein
MKSPDYDGDDFFAVDLTPFLLMSGKGRPPRLPFNLWDKRRGDLEFILEQNWDEIESEIEKIKTFDALQAMLRKLTAHHNTQIALLLEAKSNKCNLKRLRAIEKKHNLKADELRKANNALKSADDELVQLKIILAKARAGERQKVQEQIEALEAQIVKSKAQLESLQIEQHRISRLFWKLRANYAAQQVLEYLDNGKRSRINLKNLAKVLAGVSELSWRAAVTYESRRKISC